MQTSQVYLCMSFLLLLLTGVTVSDGPSPNVIAPAVADPPIVSPTEKVVDLSSSPAWDRFLSGLWASLYVIIISELGDKTFFIAAIMSMQHSRCLVYAGAIGALATMTVLSALMGYATVVIPRKFTFYCSGVLFLLFGLKMLYEAYHMSSADVQEDYEEVKQGLTKTSIQDPELGRIGPSASPPGLRVRVREFFKRAFSPVLAESFILTFLAEWGDRSQLTTIVLAATKSASGVIVGGVLGHMLCTGLAVLMGRCIAQRIPVRWITVIGGITFLFFAAFTFVGDPDSNS
ncbi:unnamed protein product [Calicophoron daubneyi]|uniref:GDT1 family protein n=1 Tax=Calicophoron daubneyi TaxID=300641 RepID=A0AAV2TNU2_CALDB